MSTTYEPDGSSFHNRSLEKGLSPSANVKVKSTNDAHHFDQSDLDQVQRRLKQRHVQMSVLSFLLIPS